MKTYSRFLATFMVLAVSLSGCSGSRSRVKAEKGMEGEIVEAEGQAPYNELDVPGSKAAALAAAQRSAVELVVGVYVNAKTRVDKAVAIENTVTAHASGYVKKYEILSEGRSGQWYKIRIRALVSTEKLHEDLDSLGLLKRPEVAFPRVALLIQEYIGEKSSMDGAATRALTQQLINKGFKVMQLPKSIDPESDPIEVAKGINRNTAELLITGLARAQSLGYGSKDMGGMASFRAAINLRVIETGSGEVITTISQIASGIEGTPEIASQKAFEKAVEMASADLTTLPTQLSQRAQVNITITGLTSFEALSNFNKSLAKERGVKDVFLRSYNQENGVAALDVYIDSISPQELADQAVRLGGPVWTVYQVTGRTIQLNASAAGR